MRTDYATRVFGDIRINVVVAAVVCIGALVYLAVVRKPREVLEGPAAGRAEPDAERGPEAAPEEAEPAVVLTKTTSAKSRTRDDRRSPGSARAPSTSTTAWRPTTPRPTGPTTAPSTRTTSRRRCSPCSPRARPSSAPARSSGPYRDVRFSTDKTPYKTHCGATAGPYYVHLGPDGLMAAGGYYMMAPDQVARFRTAVDDDRRGDDLVKRVAAVEAEGVTIARRAAQDAPARRRPGAPAAGPDPPQGPLRPPRLAARRRAARGGRARPRGRDVAGGAAARRVAGRPRRAHRAAPSVSVSGTVA